MEYNSQNWCKHVHLAVAVEELLQLGLAVRELNTCTVSADRENFIVVDW